MDEHIIGDDGGADEGDAGHNGALGNRGKRAGKYRAQVRLDHDHSHHKNDGHHGDTDGQQLFQGFDRVANVDDYQDTAAPDGCNDVGGDPGEGGETDGGAGEVAAHVCKSAQRDRGRNQSHHEPFQGGTVGQVLDQLLSQSVLGYDTQPGGHLLHDDDGDDREYHCPQQRVAIARTGFCGAGDSTWTNEGADDQNTGAHCLQLVLQCVPVFDFHRDPHLNF